MGADVRDTPLYREIEEHFRRTHEPAFGTISGAGEPAPSPDGRFVAFTGSRIEALEGLPATRLCIADLAAGTFEEATAAPGDDHSPQWSPDGRRVAFLSDRKRRGQAQVHLLEASRLGEAVAAPEVPGTAEYLSWSPDGRRLLVGVAGAGAELAGAQGSGRWQEPEEERPEWLPEVRSSVDRQGWRRTFVWRVGGSEMRSGSREGLNVWEAAWCGPGRVAAVVSDAPGEDAWYSAALAVVDPETGNERILYRSEVQIGLPAATPSGARLALVEAVCSDRMLVAGDILVIDPETGDATPVDAGGVDVTWIEWRDEDRLFFVGLQGLVTVAGELDAVTGRVEELWRSPETFGTWYPSARPLPGGGFTLVLESWDRPPELAVVRDGRQETVVSFAHEGTDYQRSIGGRWERVTWLAQDGLEIEGFVVLPEGAGPHPMVVSVHGGPVWAYTPGWGLRKGALPVLVSRGYALLFPNPRGSTGRGRAFTSMVYGDMGGGDARDILAGVDAMIDRGVADPDRIGVMGGSYGGFMAAWLVTRSDRFAAAVSISPVTNWYSQHFSSNIGHWDRLILGDDPATPGGSYFTRSPLMHAGRVRTPVLLTAGLQDRCTPPGQAVEFFQALREGGVDAELALYPQEGHGVRRFPALLDFTTRIVGWFERHMRADG